MTKIKLGFAGLFGSAVCPVTVLNVSTVEIAINPLIVAQFILLIPLFDQHSADCLLFDYRYYHPLAQKRQPFKEGFIGDKQVTKGESEVGGLRSENGNERAEVSNQLQV
jgi:hypothetical protein